MSVIHIYQSVLLGIVLVLGLYHFYLLFRIEQKAQNIFFLLMCCSIALFSANTYSLYGTGPYGRYLKLAIIQAFAMGLFHFGLTGYVATAAGLKKTLIAAYGVILFLFISAMLAFPSLMQPETVHEPIRIFKSFWGEEIYVLPPGLTVFAHVYQAFLIIAYVISGYGAASMIRRGQQKKARMIFTGLAFIIVSLCFDIAALILYIPLPLIACVGYTAMAVVLSMITSEGFIDAIIISEKLSQSEKKISEQNQELTALNEELSASNEELEASNEAFERQNEELSATIESLRASEEQYRILIETSPDPIIMLGLKGEILSVNQKAARLYGVETPAIFIEEIQNVLDILHEEDRAPAVQNMMERVATHTPGKHEYRVRLKNGSFIYTEIHTSVILDADDRPIGFVSIIRDMTDRKNIERALIESEEKFSRIYLLSPDAITISSITEGKFFEVNERTTSMLGYSRDEIIGKTGNDISLWPDPRDREMMYGELARNGCFSDLVCHYRTKDGRILVGSASGRIIEIGGERYLMAITRDITDKIKAEEEIRSRDEFKRVIFDESHIPMVVLDPDKNIFTDCNDAAVGAFGCSSKDELLGRSPIDFSAPVQYDGTASLAAANAQIQKTPASGYHYFPWRQQRPDGEQWDAEVHLTRFTHRGRPMLQFTIHDVTGRRRIEDEKERMMNALRASEERIRMTAEKLGVLFYDYDIQTGHIIWSGAIEKLTGYSDEEFMRVNITEWEKILHPDDRRRVFGVIENATSESSEYNIEYRFSRKDGTYIHVEDHGVFIHEPDNKPQRMLGLMSDISERIIAREEKDRTHSQLIQAQKMEAIGTLASGLAHDFNNMLAGIMGGLSMIKMLFEREDLKQRETIEGYVRTAQTSAERAAKMIRQLLTFSRKQDISMVPVDLNKSIEHLKIICANSFPKSVALDFIVSAAPAWVLADPTQVEQLLLNLCVNASHAMTIMRPAGQKEGGTLGIRIGEVLCDERLAGMNPGITPGEPYIKITVSDTGVGMDSTTMKRIFEPFFSTKKKEEGTGLGLSVAYGIVQQHGGIINVYSETGSGTVFSIYLPRLKADDFRKEEKTIESQLVRGHGSILIIDDEEAVIDIARGFYSTADTACSTGRTDLMESNSIPNTPTASTRFSSTCPCRVSRASKYSSALFRSILTCGFC